MENFIFLQKQYKKHSCMKKIIGFLLCCFTLVSCKKENKEETKIDTTTIENPKPTERNDFDFSKIALSEVELGEIPYFELQEDYEFQRKNASENDTLRYWTGTRFESPVGKTFEGRIVPKETKKFSSAAITEDFDSKFTKAGAVKVFEGKVPVSAIQSYIELHGEGNSIKHLDAYGFQGYANSWVYLIRQKTNNIWIQLNESDDNASMLIGITQQKAANK